VADAGVVAEPVGVTAFAGPFYPSSWAEPQLRRLKVEFAAGVAVTFVIAGPGGGGSAGDSTLDGAAALVWSRMGAA
jgi:hypothetical protein